MRLRQPPTGRLTRLAATVAKLCYWKGTGAPYRERIKHTPFPWKHQRTALLQLSQRQILNINHSPKLPVSDVLTSVHRYIHTPERLGLIRKVKTQQTSHLPTQAHYLRTGATREHTTRVGYWKGCVCVDTSGIRQWPPVCGFNSSCHCYQIPN